MDVIVVDNLIKDYGTARALDGASWTVSRGQLLGFLGPNGAGKTTTIRILLGFLKPTGGRATVLGMRAWADSTDIRRRVGYLPGDVRLYGHLTGDQSVNFVAGVRSRHGADDKRLTLASLRSEAQRLAGVLQLDLDTSVRNYSKGMRQKLGLILVLMHRPELLILDEPTAALDPLMQQALYDELRRATAEGRTVLFSSHSLAEVEALCDNVVILRAGRLVAAKPVEALRSHAGQRVHLRLAKHLDSLPGQPDGFTVDKCQDGALDGRWHGTPEKLLAWLATLPLEEVVIQRPDLEDLFLEFYETPREERS